jgi:hypothetical protein
MENRKMIQISTFREISEEVLQTRVNDFLECICCEDGGYCKVIDIKWTHCFVAESEGASAGDIFTACVVYETDLDE